MGLFSKKKKKAPEPKPAPKSNPTPSEQSEKVRVKSLIDMGCRLKLQTKNCRGCTIVESISRVVPSAQKSLDTHDRL